jgi:hypothetical protein
MNLVNLRSNTPATGATLEPDVPLWQIVPTRGADGRPLLDFMMLIPGLRNRPQQHINTTMINLQLALAPYHDVVFVNFNLKINVLWVSANARPGIILELVAAIQRLVPEALLVAQA